MSSKQGGGQLRVIGGALRGRRLRTLPGDAIRPTGDRVREALFDILGIAVRDADFLDLYAGTGAIGLEALSRGAGSVTFIEKDRAAAELIQKNLTVAGELSSRARLIREDIAQAVAILAREGRCFGFIYLDPPWTGGELDRGLRLVSDSGVVDASTLVIGEHDAHVAPPPSQLLSPWRTVRYGRAALTFYRLTSSRVDTDRTGG